jgi:hypothetical protein
VGEVGAAFEVEAPEAEEPAGAGTPGCVSWAEGVLGDGFWDAFWGALAAALGEVVWGLVFARKYCKPKKTVTRTSIITSRDLLSPPPC